MKLRNETYDLDSWAKRAYPGERVRYASGTAGFLPKTRLVTQARALYDEGMIDLVQKRSSTGYEYLAVKRRRKAEIRRENTFAFCFRGE